MADAVESVAAYTALEPLIRSRIHRGRQRDLAMEARVENGDLRDGPHQTLDRPYAFELRIDMKRRKCGNTGDRLADFGRDQYRLLEMRAAVHDPMSGCVDPRIRRGAQQVVEGLLARGAVDFVLAALLVCVGDGRDGGIAVPLDFSFPQASRGMNGRLVLNFEEASLLAARTRVECENLHCGGPGSVAFLSAAKDWQHQFGFR
jgi:hypothetical protein